MGAGLRTTSKGAGRPPDPKASCAAFLSRQQQCFPATRLSEPLIRPCDDAGVTAHDYYLSNAPPGELPGALARVARAGQRVEECLQRTKSEAGLAGYQVRT